MVYAINFIKNIKINTEVNEAKFEIGGEIISEISEKIGKVAAKIILEEGNLQYGQKHITFKHGKELEQLGMSALDFVKMVCTSFNEIREGNDRSVFLIVKNGLSKVVVVGLTYKFETGYYSVQTASPMNTRYLKKKKLLWERTAPLLP